MLVLIGSTWGAVTFFDNLPILIHQPRLALKGRQIVQALNAYAIEHAGGYPEGITANAAFRFLIKGGYLKGEAVFGGGYYEPDGQIGSAPDYAEALTKWENHWAMTKGLSASADESAPLIFEKPLQATWPPRWDAKALGSSKPGRIWRNGTILVGRKDGSVNAERLERVDGPTTTLQPIKDGKNLFELAGPHEVLDVER